MDEMNQNLSLRYKITEDEVVSTLDKMDKLQGSNKKQRLIFAVIMAIAAIDAYLFVSTKNGFTLILTMVFLVLGVFYKKKSNFSNRRLAEAFAADPEQIVDVLDSQLQLTDRATSYEEITLMVEFKKSFGLNYMGNHYFVVPKRVFADEEQMNDFREAMQAKLQGRFQDHSAKM